MSVPFIRAAVLAITLGSTVCRAGLSWQTDYYATLRQAKTERKLVLMDFTGSDWCGWCIKLKAEVFNTPEFAAFAEANLVLLEVDFPRRKAQTQQQRAQNLALQNRFGIEGYPTIIVASSEGKPLASLGYQPGGPNVFIDALKRIHGVDWKDGVPAPIAPAPTLQAPAIPNEPPRTGITFPPKHYDELKLTGLSGTAARRFAIINNQTFAAGETAQVKLQGSAVKVHCKEIRAKSVVVEVEGAGETKELFFGAN